MAEHRDPAGLDDRASRPDAVFFVPELQLGRPDPDRLGGPRQLHLPSDRRFLHHLDHQHGPARRRRADRHDRVRHGFRGPLRPGVLRPGRGTAFRDRTLLRHADGRGSGVEEPAHGSRQRAVRLFCPLGRARTCDLVHQRPAVLRRHHRGLAMGAVRHPDPAHRHAVVGSRADRGGPYGRGQGHRPLPPHASYRISPGPSRSW